DQSVHTIVVGGRAFRLSWESLKSDASPTNFFIEYFRKIASSSTSTANQQQPLLCDSLYYGLAHLRKSLLEYLFVNVGGRLFRVSWDLFSRDGRHNFFTGPLRHSLHTPPKGERNVSPLYIDRDPDIFQNIIHHLRGYTIHIRDEEHRKNLLRDAQYYVFRQLYDKLLTVMPGTALPGYSDSGTPEILMKLSDIRPSNLIKPDPQKLEESADLQYHRNVEGETSHRLLIQL
ncbi:hypothetical protein BDF20DRAFT_787590, partial [Mycotypha africana]|uniref:uncharacterized protein n=1 Tax=Mycotypha africana TaxID=64632 RepID=UPI0022FFFA49